MPRYKYIVINQENSQLNGTIGAQDEAAARKELGELGFAIISMVQMPEEEAAVVESAAKEIPVFEFAALDKNRRRVVGTIQATDRFGAFKRLVYEYAFEVEYIIDNKLNDTQKEIERIKGAADLQDKLNEELMASQKHETNEEKDLKEFEQKQAALKQQIEFVLVKVKELLDHYDKELKPETKEKIRYFIDKILRIRSSTNLEYIRKTAEDLLTFIQGEELFLNEQSMLSEKTKLLVEAKGMMMQLKQGHIKDETGIVEKLRKIRKEKLEKENASSLDKIVALLISIAIGANTETDEIIQTKKDISIIYGQIKQYLMLYFQAPSPEFKKESLESVKKLWQERNRLKQKLKLLKKIAGETNQNRANIGHGLTQEALTFTGWLLCFYLVYYFISIYATTKNIGMENTPFIFYIYKSSFLKYFLATLFLFHSSVSIKINYFKGNRLAGLIITPTFVLGTILILFNF